MTLQLEAVQEVLSGDRTRASALTGPHRRLVDAWLSDTEGPAIAGDLAALISQVLRHERAVTGLARPS